MICKEFAGRSQGTPVAFGLHCFSLCSGTKFGNQENGSLRERICIISGGIPHRLKSDINHRLYAARHSHASFTIPGPTTHFRTFTSSSSFVEKALPHYDWVLDRRRCVLYRLRERCRWFYRGHQPGCIPRYLQITGQSAGMVYVLEFGGFFLRNAQDSFAFLDAAKLCH